MTKAAELLDQFGEYFELVKKCYQCGTCAGGCPVFRQLSKFNPRTIMENVFLEDSEELFDESVIWHCSNCYTCSNRCPQGIDIAHVITKLKNISVKLNKVPPGIIEEMEAILKTGRTAVVSQSILKKREKLGLPELPKPDLDEIQKLLEVTGAVAQIKKITGKTTVVSQPITILQEKLGSHELIKADLDIIQQHFDIVGTVAQIKKIKEEVKQ
jgi:heterodisulfide reductase subunit C